MFSPGTSRSRVAPTRLLASVPAGLALAALALLAAPRHGFAQG